MRCCMESQMGELLGQVVGNVTTIFLNEEDQRVWDVNLPWYWRCVRIILILLELNSIRCGVIKLRYDWFRVSVGSYEY